MLCHCRAIALPAQASESVQMLVLTPWFRETGRWGSNARIMCLAAHGHSIAGGRYAHMGASCGVRSSAPSWRLTGHGIFILSARGRQRQIAQPCDCSVPRHMVWRCATTVAATLRQGGQGTLEQGTAVWESDMACGRQLMRRFFGYVAITLWILYVLQDRLASYRSVELSRSAGCVLVAPIVVQSLFCAVRRRVRRTSRRPPWRQQHYSPPASGVVASRPL